MHRCRVQRVGEKGFQEARSIGVGGGEGAYIETRNGFDVDGVEIKCRLDFGAKAIDWRGLYKNPGA